MSTPMRHQAPAFDTAALSIATVDAACVPGGCGGLVVELPDCRAKTADTCLGGQRVEAPRVTDAMICRALNVWYGSRSTWKGARSRELFRYETMRAALTAALSKGDAS